MHDACDRRHTAPAARTADHTVISDKTSGAVSFDADGSGSEAQFAFAKLKPGTHLSADDIYIGSTVLV
ncbi:MAG: hypothetical protein J0H08_01205 [Rhizobiales bacterium]|nr:hypothetical protein [Hyphomicrobiales bacterium]